jgi:hypothetical protein
VNLGLLGSLNLCNGFLRVDEQGLVADVDVTADGLGIDGIVDIDGQFIVVLNTSDREVNYEVCRDDGSGNNVCDSHDVPRGPFLHLRVAGANGNENAQVTLFDLIRTLGNFEMVLAPGQFSIDAGLAFQFPPDNDSEDDKEPIVELSAEASLDIRGDRIEGDFSGVASILGFDVGSAVITLDQFGCLRTSSPLLNELGLQTLLDLPGFSIQGILDDPLKLAIDFADALFDAPECRPHLFVNDASIIEGDSGTQTLNVEVVLTESTEDDFDVKFVAEQIANGAKLGTIGSSSVDVVTPGNTTITIAANPNTHPRSLKHNIQFTVVGDTKAEPEDTNVQNETFLVALKSDGLPGDVTLDSNKATVTIVDDDQKLTPRPVTIAISTLGQPGKGFLTEADAALVIEAMGLLPGDSTAVGIQRNGGDESETRSVTLTFDSPRTTVSFDDCIFEADRNVSYHFTRTPAFRASSTTLLITEFSLTEANDDSERPCSSFVFYNFEKPSFLPEKQPFSFSADATFVLQQSPIDDSDFFASKFAGADLDQPGVFKNDPGQPTRPDSLAAAGKQWESSKPFFSFDFGVRDNSKKEAPDGRIVAIDFWDLATAGAPTQWELRASVDDFKTPFARGNTHTGEFGHNRVLFSDACGNPRPIDLLPPDQLITFRIVGLNGGEQSWAVDYVALVGEFVLRDKKGGEEPQTQCLPFFSEIPNQTVTEDSGPHEVNITDIRPSPEHPDNTVTMSASVSSTLLLQVGILGTGSNRVLTFTPRANGNGVATIFVKANDGAASNNIFSREVTVTVTAVNDPPVIADFRIVRNPNATSEFNLLDHVSDADGETPTTFALPTSGVGTVNPTGQPGRFIYTPVPITSAANDAIIVHAIDSQGVDVSRSIPVFVNTAPTASDSTVCAVRNQPRTIDLRTRVSDDFTTDDELIYSIFDGTGTFSLNGPIVTMAPSGLGTKTFQYRVRDRVTSGQGLLSRTATVTVNVSQVCTAAPPGGTIGGTTVNGYVSRAIVFFDANRNSVADFLDLDGDQAQDANEPSEPSTQTFADGSFNFEIPTAFDRNGDGALTSQEGRLVAVGGLVTSTLLPQSVTLAAPAESQIVSPITTIIVAQIEKHAMSLAAAVSRVQQAFGLGQADPLRSDPIALTLSGNVAGARLAAVAVQLSDVAGQTASLLHGITSRPIGELAAAVYDSIAAMVAENGAAIDLSDREVMKAVIINTATRVGVELAPTLIDSATTTIAATNDRIAQIALSADIGFLNALYRVEAVAQGSVASDLTRTASGQLSENELVTRNTGPALEDQLAREQLGNIVAPVISLNSVALPEGNAGVTRFEFHATLSRSSAIEVTALITTVDDTAVASRGDYSPLATTLTFQPGETEKAVIVEVATDGISEPNQTFFVTLSSPRGAILAGAQSIGTILNDDQNGPVVTRVALPARGKKITGAVLTFDSDLDRVQAERLTSYELRAPGKDVQFGTRDDKVLALRSATYDASARTVTLTPAKQLKTNKPFQFTVRDTVRSATGVPLDGDSNGTPGGAHIVRGGLWSQIVYVESDGDQVELQLAKCDPLAKRGRGSCVTGGEAGWMEVTWGANVNGRRVQLVDTVLGSVLAGKVKRSPQGNGFALIESLSGTAGVDNRLTSPPFIIGDAPAAAIDAALASQL